MKLELLNELNMKTEKRKCWVCDKRATYKGWVETETQSGWISDFVHACTKHKGMDMEPITKI